MEKSTLAMSFEQSGLYLQHLQRQNQRHKLNATPMMSHEIEELKEPPLKTLPPSISHSTPHSQSMSPQPTTTTTTTTLPPPTTTTPTPSLSSSSSSSPCPPLFPSSSSTSTSSTSCDDPRKKRRRKLVWLVSTSTSMVVLLIIVLCFASTRSQISRADSKSADPDSKRSHQDRASSNTRKQRGQRGQREPKEKREQQQRQQQQQHAYFEYSQYSEYFPDAGTILDMVTLSYAVYKLRNKVSSCHDPQRWNGTLIALLVEERERERVMEMDGGEDGTDVGDVGDAGDSGDVKDEMKMGGKDPNSMRNERRSSVEGGAGVGVGFDVGSNRFFGNDNDIHNQSQVEDLFHLLLPPNTTCLYYSHDYDLGRQVLIVRSENQRNETYEPYVAVAYAGTDDWQTALTDGDILTGGFGPSFDDDSANATNSFNAADATNEELKKLFQTVPEGVKVHRGFNSAVFDNEGFSTVLKCIESARMGGDCSDISSNTSFTSSNSPNDDHPPNRNYPHYRLLTTGHSLGAANSVLLGAALHLAYPEEPIRSINFGCPKIGNADWSFWVDSLQLDGGGVGVGVGGRNETGVGAGAGVGGKKTGGRVSLDDDPKNKTAEGGLEIFRFVNKIDLIPRLPELLFQHAGHTLQMSVGGGIKAYYDHWGNENLGFLGVPYGWGAAPYVFLPGALSSHFCRHYVSYLQYYQPTLPNSTNPNNRTLYHGKTPLYFVREFERAGDNDTDDAYHNPPEGEH